MEGYVQIGRSFFAVPHEGSESLNSTEPTPPEPPSQFAAQMAQILGESSEPDPLFFVESWTVGVAAAVDNLQQRRQRQSNSTSCRPVLHPFDNRGPLNFVDVTVSDEAFFKTTRANTVADSYTAGRPTQFREETPAPKQSATSQAWQSFVDDFEISQDSVQPTTVESACQLLGVPVTSTREQIKGAYRRMANRYHPDRLESRSERERIRGTDRMASINEAYRLLRTTMFGEAA